MIKVQTILDVVDNSRGRYAQCIKVFKGKTAKIGDTILVSLKKVKPVKKNQKSKVKKGQVYKALILRTKNLFYRKDGTNVKFSQNAVILLDNKEKPIGTRSFGPSVHELRSLKKFKIISIVSSLI